ncbi:hypothetical protein [Kutzneria sp. NPDC052558]|uniref:hypothetical protein n=1 Tax=Kutzneria sp. NPDC052558 TaxID=3364121 RepID=UPI0037CA6ED3
MTSPRFDITAAHPEFLRLRTAVGAGDWAAVEQFFASMPDDNWTARATWIVAEVAGVEEFLRRVPRSRLSRLLLASRHIAHAWEIRSGKQAKYVSAQQFAGMHDALRAAEAILIDLTAEDPSDTIAWLKRIPVCMGLQLGQSEARRRYDRLARHNPHLLPAQTALVQQLCPKWSGSWESLHAFARECMNAAPPGSLNPIVVGEAHLEHAQAIGKAGRAEYLAGVEAELDEAVRKSLLHPAFRKVPGWVSAHGVFAVLSSWAGNQAKAAVHFQALGDLASSYPWESCFTNPAAGFQELRAAALGGKR